MHGTVSSDKHFRGVMGDWAGIRARQRNRRMSGGGSGADVVSSVNGKIGVVRWGVNGNGCAERGTGKSWVVGAALSVRLRCYFVTSQRKTSCLCLSLRSNGWSKFSIDGLPLSLKLSIGGHDGSPLRDTVYDGKKDSGWRKNVREESLESVLYFKNCMRLTYEYPIESRRRTTTKRHR